MRCNLNLANYYSARLTYDFSGFGSTEDEEIPGNFGLKDQVMALKWIQENIGSYGGNPNSVTVFGICSGGASVHYLMLSPLSKGECISNGYTHFMLLNKSRQKWFEN